MSTTPQESQDSDLTVREVFHRSDLARLQSQLVEYREKYNLLSPVVSIEWIPEFYSISAVRVPVDTRIMKKGGEVFEVGYAKKAEEKQFALSKSPIERCAMAVGIDVIQVIRVDDRTDAEYCECRADILVPDVGTGRSRRVQRGAEIDLREGSALCNKMIREAEKAYSRKCEYNERKGWEPPRPPEPMVRINEMRATIVRRCETAAVLRAYRTAMGIKPHYDALELRKPFLALRMVESGMSDDPEARKAYRQMALARMAGASDALFGYQGQRPKEVIPATAIPVEDKVDKDPGGGDDDPVDVDFEDPFSSFSGEQDGGR